MGKVSVTLFPSVDKRSFDFSFSLVSKLSGWNPFAVKEEFSFCGKPYNIVLLQFVQFQEHLVIIITTIHDKGCSFKQSGGTFYSRKGDIVDGSKAFLFGRMDL